MDAKALARLERAPLPLRAFRARALALAAASGVAATVALLLGPVGRDLPELPLPYVGLDLRLIALPALFPLLHAATANGRWPRPALLLPALALGLAGAAHAQGSALFALLGLEGAVAGARVDLVTVGASGASVLLALGAALDRAADRLAVIAERARVPPDRVLALERAAWSQAERLLGFGAASFVALLLAARAGDALVGGAEAVAPELVGAGVAVVVAVLLFPGAGRSRTGSSASAERLP